MENYTMEQRVLIVKHYYQNGESLIAMIRKVGPIFGRNNVPNSFTLKRIVKKFERTGSVTVWNTRHELVEVVEEHTVVRESVAESPGMSIRHSAQELDITKASLQRILTKDLHFHVYKLQLTQQLLPTDHAQRREFTNWILEQQEVNADFAEKIIFIDEARFSLKTRQVMQ